jgi:hypothetical protein
MSDHETRDRLTRLEIEVEGLKAIMTNMQDVISSQAEMNQKLININDKFVNFQKESSEYSAKREIIVEKMGRDIHIVMKIVFMMAGGLTLIGILAPIVLPKILQ